MSGGRAPESLPVDETAEVRQRQANIEDVADRQLGGSDPGAASWLCKTTTITTYPTTAAVYYAVVPCDAAGTETEGSAGTITAVKGKFVALNLGASIPPSGTPVLVTRVGGRWVFRYG